MSVFYNLTKHATNNEEQNARFEAFGGDGAVVLNPSDYSVGVNRFKIPLGTIPIYRFYDKEYNLGVVMKGQSSYFANAERKGTPDLRYVRSSLFDGSQIFASYGRYGIDLQNDNKKYKDVFSQDDVVENLNQAMVRSFDTLLQQVANGGKRVQGNIHPFSNQSISYLYDSVAPFSGNAVVIPNINIPQATAGTLDNNYGEIIVGLELTLKQIDVVAPTTNLDLSNFDFYLHRTSNVGTITDEVYLPLVIGQCEGMDAFNGNTTLNHQISWGSSHNHHIGSSQNRDTTLINAYRERSGSNLPFYVYMEDTNLEGLMGKRYDGYTYELLCKNKTQLIGQATPQFATIPAGSIQLNFKTLNLEGVPNYVFTQPTPNLTNSYLIPYWTFGDDNRVSFNANTNYLNGFQIKLYMNNALFNLFSLKEYKTRVIDSSNKSLALEDSTNIFNDTDNGVLLNFNTELLKRQGNGRITQGDEVQFKEAISTTFARDFLNSIIISTGAIAIDGEYVADGDSRRRILTDFTIDPSTTSRDYLVFSNQGGMRFYSVRSTEPLRRIDVQVSYQDIYGKVRPLMISASQELNLKLEFRPNTQLYAMDGDYSIMNQ